MSLPQGIKDAFDFVQGDEDAGYAGRAALLEVTDKTSGKSRFLLTQVVWDGEQYEVHPIGELFDPEVADRVFDQCEAP